MAGRAWLEDLRRDVTYALRMMRRAPGATTVAILSLALGIGANTVLFSVFDALLLRTLRVDKPEQLVRIESNFGITHPACLNLQERAQVYSSIAEILTFDRWRVAPDSFQPAARRVSIPWWRYERSSRNAPVTERVRASVNEGRHPHV